MDQSSLVLSTLISNSCPGFELNFFSFIIRMQGLNLKTFKNEAFNLMENHYITDLFGITLQISLAFFSPTYSMDQWIELFFAYY